MAAKPTFKLVLFAKDNRDGSRSVALRVTYRRKSKYFFLSRQCQPDQWSAESGRFSRGFPDYRKENDILRTYEQRASDAVRQMERDGVAFSFDRFEHMVFGPSASGAVRLSDFILSVEEELTSAGKAGNAATYRTLRGVLSSFRPRAALADLDAAFLSRFEAFCSARGVATGGLSVYLRTLRAICNRAIRRKVMPRGWYPFESYSLSHLKSGKARKAAPLEFIRALEQAPASLSVDLFLFSFYCRGINFADICELTRDNIQGGRLVYKRKKTGGVFSVALSDRALAIVDRYKDEREKRAPIFPVFSARHKTEKKKLDRRKTMLRNINRELRRVAADLGFDVPGLSFYTARHTYANGLKQAGVSVAVISEALGHGDVKTTDAYLKSFGDDVLDAADRLLL